MADPPAAPPPGVEPSVQAAPVEGLPPLPLAPPALFPSQLEDEGTVGLAGIHGGRLFIRHPDDLFRLYPGGRLRTDFYAAPGAPDLLAGQAGEELHPRFALRRVRLELSGEILERVGFTMGLELGGLRIGDTDYFGSTTPRMAMSSAHDGTVMPADVSVSYRLRKWLGFTAGQFNAPFSMANRTRETVTPMMERNLAIRGFVMPNNKELGLSVWGELGRERLLAYELGIFNGDGPTRPAVDANFDFMGRIFSRPLVGLGDGSFYKLAQIGVSGRVGSRDQGYVAYDYPTVASNQGVVLWQPGYVDSLGRVTHVIPSGAQRAIGGELRLPFDIGSRALDLRGEVYYVANNTREGVDGFEFTNTERFGRVNGVGWYALASFWACGDTFISGEPGVHRPVTVDLDSEAPTKRGFEIFAVASGIAANYDGATREGSTPDANTPSSNIAVYQFGGGVTYWYSQAFRATINYLAYFAPDSGDIDANQVLVPDNIHNDGGMLGDGHAHHELGTRLAVSF